MKPNWSLIAGCVFFAAAVFAIAVLEGFNSVERPASYETAAHAGGQNR